MASVNYLEMKVQVIKDRKIKSLVKISSYFGMEEEELLDRILVSISNKLGVKITRGKKKPYGTYLHLEIRE